MRRQFVLLVVLAGIVATVSRAGLDAQRGASREVEWLYYGGDSGGMRHSSLNDINAGNIQRMKIAWQWKHWDVPLKEYGTQPDAFESTPLMIDGVVYVTTPYNNIAALDAETGKELWRFDGEAYKLGKLVSGGWKLRGTAFWRDGDKLRIFLNARSRLFCLDAKTGKPVPSFGKNGETSLTDGLSRVGDKARSLAQSSAPVVYKDLVILGSQISDQDQLADPVGQVQAINARTGKREWVFSVIPQSPTDPGADSWENESWRVSGHANVWATMALDEARGLIYAPTSTPNSDSYGGRRPGAGLFAESLVCLDAATGKIKWYFQTVHHGLWDYDNPTQPNLVTITVDGKRIDAVVLTTKQGFAYVFDRVTGTPVWPIVERPVPADTDVPGEKLYATQPVPTKPPAFVDQGVTLEDANNLTPEIKALAQKEMQKFRLGPLYTPPSLRGTLQRPAQNGGLNWGGAAFDPQTGYLIVRAANAVGVNRVAKNDGSDPLVQVEYSNIFGRRLGEGVRMPAGLPIVSPPYAVLTAIDLNKGEIAWRIPLGEGSTELRNNPLLKGVKLPDRLGSPDSRGGALVAGNLVYVGGGDEHLYAFDTRTGKEVWRGEIPYANTANPMTYRTKSGRQFVVTATGAGTDNALLAFALPD